MNVLPLIPDTTALQESLAYLPLATYEPGETVLAAGSKTGRLLFLKDGAVAVVVFAVAGFVGRADLADAEQHTARAIRRAQLAFTGGVAAARQRAFGVAVVDRAVAVVVERSARVG